MKNTDTFDFKNRPMAMFTKKEIELASKIQNVRTQPKIGRNEPCPCHSGKKYKKCCL